MTTYRFWIAAAVSVAAFMGTAPADAITLTAGQSATITFTATTGTPPYDYVPLTLDFGTDNPFGTNETLKFSTFNANNTPLTSMTVSSGNSIYTSGINGLTENGISPFSLSTALTTQTFYAIVTDVTGSFDLTSAFAGFEHVIATTGTNQLSVEGSISATPIPAALPLFAGGLGALGLFGWRKKRKAITA